MGEREGGWAVVKDAVELKYHRLQNEQFALMKLLDGRRSLDELRGEMTRRFPGFSLSPNELQELIADLHEKGLLLSLQRGQGEQLLARSKERSRRRVRETFSNFLSLRLPGWDPDRVLAAIDPWVRWMFRPWAAVLAGVLVLSAWLLLLMRFEEFRQDLPEFREFFGGKNLLLLWLTLAGAKVLHEFGHGLACKRYGGECHSMGVMLLVFSPCLYCDVTDSWMLPDKRRRMIISAAGMIVETVLSAAAIFVWHMTSPGLLHHLAMNVFFVTTLTTVAFNANPLMRLDGYYILADAVGVPNVRQKASHALNESFAWRCLGIEIPPDPFPAEIRRPALVGYAAASHIYRWTVTLSICSFLCVVLKPHGLQSIGIAMAAVALFAAMSGLVLSVVRILQTPRSETMSFRKVALTLSALSGAVAVAVTVPVSQDAVVPFVLQPRDVRHLVTTDACRLIELHVSPGETVREGQLLAILQSDEMEDERQQLEREWATAKISVARARHQRDRAEEHLASSRRASLAARRADLEARFARLTIHAPCAGIVVPPPQRRDRDASGENQLETWTGTPFDRMNLGCHLAARTHLLSIAPTSELDARLIVEQEDRDELAVGDTVRLRFHLLAGLEIEGRVQAIGLSPMETLASNQDQSAQPKSPSRDGGKPFQSIAYQARVAFPQNDAVTQPGLQGEARVRRRPRTLADWTWRWLRRTWTLMS